MMKILDSLCVIRTDATGKKERNIAVIGFENRPVKLLSRAASALALRVEEKHIHVTVVFMPFLQITFILYAQCFDNLDVGRNIWNECVAEIVYHHSRLTAMQLHIVEVIIIHTCDNILWHIIHEYSHGQNPLVVSLAFLDSFAAVA